MGQQQQQQLGSPQGMFQQQNPPQSVGGGSVRSLADLEQQKLPPQAPPDPIIEIKRLLNTGNLEAAFSQALGDKLGIARYGFCLPMDDCLAQVALDFGGRNWLKRKASFKS